MKKLTTNLLVSALCLCTKVHATNYYFSSSTGNDSRSSAQAQNSSTPWKTLSKLNSIMSTLKAGDFVYFKRGDIFYGSIGISSKSGSSGSPITFGAYGSGAKPIITGFTTVGSWISIGSGLYETTLSGGLSSLTMVVLNGSFQPIGRYPKATAANAGYLILTSHSGTSSISSSQLSGIPSFIGGQIVIRKTHWILDKATVTAQSSSSVTYSGSGYTPTDKFGFFFQNHSKACTAAGDWCYDPSAKKIKMYFGSSGTAGKVVQAATIDVLLTLSYANYITFDNLSFNGSNSKTFSISGSKYIIINACDFSFAGGDGMNVVSNCSNITVQNSTANWSNNNFISAGGSTYWNITNNIISNTGSVGGMGNNGDGTYTSIYNIGDGSKAQYNTIKNTGYTSIFFRGNSISILNNFIDTFCGVKDDGAAIYSFTGSTPTTNAQRTVSNNIIVNGTGVPAGTTTPFSCAYGIYMDNNASNLTISGNSIANCGSAGIYLHGTHDLSITNNTIYNCVINAMYGQFYMKEESSQLLRNHTVTGNKYISKASTQLVAFFLTPSNDINQFGTIDNNYYCRPLKELSTFTLYKSSGNLTTDLKGWQSFSGKDLHSYGSPKTITNVNDLRFEYNAANSSKVVNLGANYIDVKGTSYPGKITLAPYTSAVLISSSASSALAVNNTAEIAGENGRNMPNESLVIHPNPVTDNFALHLNNAYTGKMNIEIVNQSGAVIRSLTFDKSQQINTVSLVAGDLPPGLYFVHVQIGNWSQTKKLLKL